VTAGERDFGIHAAAANKVLRQMATSLQVSMQH
jgi:hypothetical protein